jgi:serine/threonine protein kinase
MVLTATQEIIHYPTVRMIQHLGCRRIREGSIEFDSHMSGFVYKVRIRGQTLIKKEIPGPDTVDEFLYEINALSRLSNSRNVIPFHGVIVDDYGERVKGLLISYAEQGALIDILFDHDHGLPWFRRERWARQIVEGLSEIHELGFVQGDFTLSNIVVDDEDNAKIIDINRRGCPVGWEPPEATPLIESNQRISMYIGVKSDLYQLGMVLWALAEQEDEPETHGRPLRLSEGLDVPEWYRTVVSICLADDPRHRMQAIDLLRMFPQRRDTDDPRRAPPSISVDDGQSLQEYVVDGYQSDGPRVIRTVQPPPEWSQGSSVGHTYVNPPTGITHQPYFYHTRGRSPPSPMPSNLGYCERGYDPPWSRPMESSFDRTRTPTESDISPEEMGRGRSGPDTISERKDNAHERVSVPEDPPTPELVVKDDSALSIGTHDEGRLHSEKQEPLADILEHIDTPASGPRAPNNTGGEAPVELQNHAIPVGGAVQGADASNSMKVDVQDEDKTQSTQTPQQQNPLFEGSGNTEPEAPGSIALVPGEAEVQTHKSTRQVLVPKEAEGGRGERVDSAIEMTAPPPHLAERPGPAARHRSSASSGSAGGVPAEFLGIGSGYDDSVAAVTSDAIDEDLVI